MLRSLTISICLTAVLWGCGTKNVYRPDPASKRTEVPSLELGFESLLYHLDTGRSVVILRIPTNTLLSKIDPATQEQVKSMKVTFTALTSKGRDLIDTDTVRMILGGRDQAPPFIYVYDTLNLHTHPEGEASLRIQVTDENKRRVARRAYVYRKDGRPREDYFLVTDKDGTPIFPDETTPKDALVHSHTFAKDTLKLHHYKSLGKVALPPFSTRSADPNFASADSVIRVNFDQDNKFKLSEFKGSILISDDTTFPVGLTVNSFEEDFPGVTSYREMALALRYITDRDEFQRLSDTSRDTRAEVEKFWLARTKYRENARRLIKEYYARVRYANEHFSSYKEGWKTDRGMIHIVFGPPTSRDVFQGKEVWTYGDGYRIGSVSFTFYQREYSISKNDMELMRNPSYRTHWNVAVEEWRYGRVKTQ